MILGQPEGLRNEILLMSETYIYRHIYDTRTTRREASICVRCVY